MTENYAKNENFINAANFDYMNSLNESKVPFKRKAEVRGQKAI